MKWPKVITQVLINPVVFNLLDLPVMARQVNTFLCSAMGCYSTTHCHLHDQSVHTTGGLSLIVFACGNDIQVENHVQCSVKVKRGEAQSRKADGVCWKTTCQADRRQTQCECHTVPARNNVTDSIFSCSPSCRVFDCYCTGFTGSTT